MSEGVLPDWLRQRARTTPDRLALLVGGAALDFAELDRRASAAARALAALGVRPGDRVALLAANGLPFVEVVHGLMRLGAVLVPLNTRLGADEVAWQLDDAGAGFLLHDGSQAALAAAARARAGGAVGSAAIGPGPGSGGPALADLVPGDLPPREYVDLAAPHCIVYTSGTTGTPKGAVLTYGNHWWSAIGSALNLGLHLDDRWLACLPLFHVGGLAILLRSAIYGIATVVHGSFDPAAVNRAIDEEGVTIVSVVSTMLARMLEARAERAYPATLRCLLLGGGPVARSLLEASARLGAPVVQTYGLTEAASQVATLPPADALRKLGSAGKPLLPTELRIERAGRVAPAGVVGEIVVRGPTVTPGYAGRPGATAEALRDGWLHTGDAGYLDQEGYLYVVDRRDDLIVTGGENVYPAEVEAALLAHPAVAEAGVAGVADDEWGQTVVAAVRLRPGVAVGPEELVAFCRQRLAGYKVPRRLRVLDALPRNAAGKLLRRQLPGLVS